MPAHDPPVIFIIAGPNGAGKSTAAPFLLDGLLDIKHYVNADTIAAGLSAFDPASVAFAAGRIMLQRIDQLAAARQSFGIETTLATRTYAPLIRELKSDGYRCHLLFLALADPRLAVARVAQRVQLGGHDIPPDVIHRRFHAGLSNFFELYEPLADIWKVYDNGGAAPTLIAKGAASTDRMVNNPASWNRLLNIIDRPQDR